MFGSLKNVQIVVLGICIALGTIISTVILSEGLIKFKKASAEVINVTGSAEKKIISDYAVWTAGFSVRDTQLKAAFAKLKEDTAKVKAYLGSKGIKDGEVIISQVETTPIYKKNDKGNATNDIEAYLLSQRVEVRSADVNKITAVSRESTELIEQDIRFVSDAPQYFYTKLGELKLEMLAAAAADAKKRAGQIASASGNRIGRIRSADMGVFQITPVNSTEVSAWGENDTSSLEKKVFAVVHADFAIIE
jgi:hypothetical protein